MTRTWSRVINWTKSSSAVSAITGEGILYTPLFKKSTSLELSLSMLISRNYLHCREDFLLLFSRLASMRASKCKPR